jgi:hypothetical protein
MGYHRISGLTTISGHGHHHWEYNFADGDAGPFGDVGPCYATAELFVSYDGNRFDDTYAQLVANNQGVITRERGSIPLTNVTLTYTVDIDNTDDRGSAYFLRIGRF